MNTALARLRAAGAISGWPLVVILALAPLWLVGVLDRNLWTPDEPREADMVWHMSSQIDRAVPELAGVPFVEKPPLTYWIASASQTVFGESAAAARAPNLLYAALTALAIGAIAFAMRGATAAIVAALVAGSSLLAWRVTSWLAPDACLLAGCSIALLGVYHGYRAKPGVRKLLGYTLMHIGAAVGFMAKSAPGWLVPALALVTLIVWEHRGSELKRWELYAGLIVQALIIGPWILAVERMPQGIEMLRVLFWNNVVGRFAHIPAPETLDYTRGHKNWPGRYLVELPLSFLPWTLLVIAALRRSWDRVRASHVPDADWRFAIAACLPFLLLLSLSATARDVYAAPLFPGMGLLVALWSTESRHIASRLDEFALQGTYRIVAIMALVFAIILIVVPLTGAAAGPVEAYAFVALLSAGIAIFCWRSGARRAQRASTPRAIVWAYSAHALAFAASALLLFPVFDRWQDLGALARRVQMDTAGQLLGLLQPDETTIAMLDYRLRIPFTVLPTGPGGSSQSAAEWFRRHGNRARILVMLPGHAAGELTPLIERWQRRPPRHEDDASALERAGIARTVALYQLPYTRRYALLAPGDAYNRVPALAHERSSQTPRARSSAKGSLHAAITSSG